MTPGLFSFAAGQDDEELFRTRIYNYFSDLDIVVLCLSGSQLYEAVAETQALRRVQIEKNELNADAVAMREFEDRISSAELMQFKLLQDLIDKPKGSLWFNRSNLEKINDKRQLQEFMSRVLEQAYYKAPIIHNELINRDYPSSQAVGARNKLLSLIINASEKEDFGIEKFPAEKAIYRSLLLTTGLHKKIKNKWTIQSQIKRMKKLRLVEFILYGMK